MFWIVSSLNGIMKDLFAILFKTHGFLTLGGESLDTEGLDGKEGAPILQRT